MKKFIAALVLTAAVASPALASDGSETVWHSQAQRGYVAMNGMSDGMGAYASTRATNWQPAQDVSISRQEQIQWSLNDR